MTYDSDRQYRNWRQAVRRKRKGTVRRVPRFEAWLLHPFCRAALSDLPCESYTLHGPFGLGRTYSVCFLHQGKALFYVQLRVGSSNGVVHFLKLHSNTGRFRSGSIGAINGFNYEAVAFSSGTHLLEVFFELNALLPEIDRVSPDSSTRVYC